MTKQAPDNGVQLLVYKNYDLSELDLEFVVADFERQVKPNHVANIARAIMDGTLYDTIITVVDSKDEGGAYVIIDGQHRFEALKMLFENEDLDVYSFGVRVLKSVDARKAYRVLNAGKPLTGDDILKSYDDGKVQFFNKLREYCAFYATDPRKMPYSQVARAFKYATDMHGMMISRDDMITVVTNISESDLNLIHNFLYIIAQSTGIIPREPFFKVPIFWNTMRLYWKNRSETNPAGFSAKFARFVHTASLDKEIAFIAKQGRNNETLAQAHDRLEAIWQAS